MPGFPSQEPEDPREVEKRARILHLPSRPPTWEEEVDDILEARRQREEDLKRKSGVYEVQKALSTLPPRNNDVSLKGGEADRLKVQPAEEARYSELTAARPLKPVSSFQSVKRGPTPWEARQARDARGLGTDEPVEEVRAAQAVFGAKNEYDRAKEEAALAERSPANIDKQFPSEPSPSIVAPAMPFGGEAAATATGAALGLAAPGVAGFVGNLARAGGALASDAIAAGTVGGPAAAARILGPAASTAGPIAADIALGEANPSVGGVFSDAADAVRVAGKVASKADDAARFAREAKVLSGDLAKAAQANQGKTIRRKTRSGTVSARVDGGPMPEPHALPGGVNPNAQVARNTDAYPPPGLPSRMESADEFAKRTQAEGIASNPEWAYVKTDSVENLQRKYDDLDARAGKLEKKADRGDPKAEAEYERLSNEMFAIQVELEQYRNTTYLKPDLKDLESPTKAKAEFEANQRRETRESEPIYKDVWKRKNEELKREWPGVEKGAERQPLTLDVKPVNEDSSPPGLTYTPPARVNEPPAAPPGLPKVEPEDWQVSNAKARAAITERDHSFNETGKAALAAVFEGGRGRTNWRIKAGVNDSDLAKAEEFLRQKLATELGPGVSTEARLNAIKDARAHLAKGGSVGEGGVRSLPAPERVDVPGLAGEGKASSGTTTSYASSMESKAPTPFVRRTPKSGTTERNRAESIETRLAELDAQRLALEVQQKKSKSKGRAESIAAIDKETRQLRDEILLIPKAMRELEDIADSSDWASSLAARDALAIRYGGDAPVDGSVYEIIKERAREDLAAAGLDANMLNRGSEDIGRAIHNNPGKHLYISLVKEKAEALNQVWAEHVARKAAETPAVPKVAESPPLPPARAAPPGLPANPPMLNAERTKIREEANKFAKNAGMGAGNPRSAFSEPARRKAIKQLREAADAAVTGRAVGVWDGGDDIRIDLGKEGVFTIKNTPEAIATVLNRLEKPSERPPGVIGTGPLMAMLDPSTAAGKAARALDSAFSRPEPYASTLPESIQSQQRAAEAATGPRSPVVEEIAKKARISAASVDGFWDRFSGVGKEPGFGTDVTGPGGKAITLQDELKSSVHERLAAEEVAAETADAFKRKAQSPEDMALAYRVLDLRDLKRQVAEDAAAGRTRATVYGRTPEAVDALLREAETALATSPGAAEMVAEFRRATASTEADLKAMGFKFEPKKDYYPRQTFLPEDAAAAPIGATGSMKKRKPSSAKHREGSDRFTDLDGGEVLYKHVREVKQAKVLHDFAKKLQNSDNNLIPHLIEDGGLPAGVKPEDVSFWSFEQGAPEISGLQKDALIEKLVSPEEATKRLEKALRDGDESTALEIVHQFTQGRSKPYILAKKSVVAALDGLRVRPEETGLGTVAMNGLHWIFRAGTLSYRNFLGYIARNVGGDTANLVALAARKVRVGGYEVPGLGPAVDIVNAVVRNPLELAGRRVKELMTGTPDEVLKRAREDRALSSGLFGAAGSMHRRGALNRFVTGKEGVRDPYKSLPPGWKLVRLAENTVTAPFRFIREAQVLLEAAPRKAAIDSLLAEGYSRKAAVVKGNQVLVDYAMLSDQAQTVKKLVAPFLAWPLTTASNFIKFPVRSGKNVVSRMLAFYTALQTYNWLVTPDQEREADPDLQASPHINLGTKDEHGRWVSYDLRKVGMEAPTVYKAVAWAAGNAIATQLGDELAKEVERVADAAGSQAGKEALRAFGGPAPQAFTALMYGKDFATGDNIERRHDELLPPDERAQKNAVRFGVKSENTRLAAAVAPLAGPLQTYSQLTQNDPLRAESKLATVMGDPRRYTEPFARTLALRRTELKPTLTAYANAIEKAATDPNARQEADRLFKRLVELRVDRRSIKAYITARKNARKKEQMPTDRNRAILNTKYGPPPGFP